MVKPIISTTLMEPMLPSAQAILEDLAVNIIEKSARMAAQLPLIVQDKIGDLIRTMNCYYSNLIEGHNTHPRDIEQALKENFSSNQEKRDLQLEAKAHIEVQLLLDQQILPHNVYSKDMITTIHREFYSRLPKSLRFVNNPDTGENIEVIPGQFRSSDVIVGMHIPPKADYIGQFMQRFEEAYNAKHLSRTTKIIAIAAAHHRLLWIHPFYDGNGRVTRLLSHIALKSVGVGNSLWSISRGLARNAGHYKANLALADSQREGDLDGRGNLSEKYLVKFCNFFLSIAIDQIEFMQKILDLTKLLERIELYSINQIAAKQLPKASNIVLREALLKGLIPRGVIPTLTGYSDRQSRNIVANLVKKELLTSDTPYGDLYLNFPQHVLEFYFPSLYID